MSFAELDDAKSERDQAYVWLRDWQKWALGLLRSRGRYQGLTIPGDAQARDEIAEMALRPSSAEPGDGEARRLLGRLLVAEMLHRQKVEKLTVLLRDSSRCVDGEVLRDARAGEERTLRGLESVRSSVVAYLERTSGK